MLAGVPCSRIVKIKGAIMGLKELCVEKTPQRRWGSVSACGLHRAQTLQEQGRDGAAILTRGFNVRSRSLWGHGHSLPIHSLSEHLRNTSCVLGTASGVGDTDMNQHFRNCPAERAALQRILGGAGCCGNAQKEAAWEAVIEAALGACCRILSTHSEGDTRDCGTVSWSEKGHAHAIRKASGTGPGLRLPD